MYQEGARIFTGPEMEPTPSTPSVEEVALICDALREEYTSAEIELEIDSRPGGTSWMASCRLPWESSSRKFEFLAARSTAGPEIVRALIAGLDSQIRTERPSTAAFLRFILAGRW